MQGEADLAAIASPLGNPISQVVQAPPFFTADHNPRKQTMAATMIHRAS